MQHQEQPNLTRSLQSIGAWRVKREIVWFRVLRRVGAQGAYVMSDLGENPRVTTFPFPFFGPGGFPCPPRSYPASAVFISSTLVSACYCKLFVQTLQSILSECCWQIMVKDAQGKSQLPKRGVVYCQQNSPLHKDNSKQYQPNNEDGFDFDLAALQEKLATAKNGKSAYDEVLKIFGAVVLCH